MNDDQIRKKIKQLIDNSTNRMYGSDLLMEEININSTIFFTRCQQCNKDKTEMIKKIESTMHERKNLAFCQAVVMTFELKDFTSYLLDGWKPKTKIIKRK